MTPKSILAICCVKAGALKLVRKINAAAGVSADLITQKEQGFRDVFMTYERHGDDHCHLVGFGILMEHGLNGLDGLTRICIGTIPPVNSTLPMVLGSVSRRSRR